MPADPSAAWDSGNIARSNAERGRYAPEFDCNKKHATAALYGAPIPYVGGMTD